MNLLELIKTFPEVEGIAKEKLDELYRHKDGILKERTMPFLDKVNTIKDEFSKWYWKEAYKVMDTEFVRCNEQIKYWERVKKLIPNREKHQSFEVKKEAAKNVSILELYPFERLRRVGTRYQASCPFHEDKTPSFVIYPDKGWYCFSCNRGGDSIDFIKQLKNVDFKQAVFELGEVCHA